MKARNNKGFTLVEILVGLAVSALVLTAIYQIYLAQQKSYIVQEEVAKMQQNLRAALLMMVSDLRMAGFDPTGNTGAGIDSIAYSLTSPTIRITKDLNGNGSVGDAGEDITYSLITVDGVQKLNRDDLTEGGDETVADNIEVLNLECLDEDYNYINNCASLSAIRSIQITLVARSARSEQNYTNNFIYRNQRTPGVNILGPAGDNVRRSILTAEVNCRNLGL